MLAERIDGIFDSSGGGFTRLEQVVEVITQCAQLISLHAHCLEPETELRLGSANDC